jgi:SNF2 family DNA or RNA helicase
MVISTINKVTFNTVKTLKGNYALTVTMLYDAYNKYSDVLKPIFKQLKATYTPALKAWVLPLTVYYITQLQKTFNQLGFTVELTEAVKQFIRERQQVHNIDLENLPPSLRGYLESYADRLYSHQIKGIAVLVLAKKLILGDEMGLGKTVQTVLAIQYVFNTYRTPPKVLIVCPKSLIRVWQEHLETWLDPEQKQTIIENTTIINYEQFRKVYKTLQKDTSYRIVIADEAHRLKNRKALQSKAFLVFIKTVKPDYTWLLTGTPIVNRPDEIWHLLAILQPAVYTSYWNFVARHCEIYDRPWGKEIGGLINPVAYNTEVNEFLLRRTKADHLDLPPKVYHKHYITLSNKELKAYKQLEKEFITTFDLEDFEAELEVPTVLAQLTRLQQLALDYRLPLLNTNEVTNFEVTNFEVSSLQTGTKLASILEFIDNDIPPENNVIVFTTFASFIKLFVKAHKAGRPLYLITGETPAQERLAIVEKFNSSTGAILAATMQTAGEGLTLTSATDVIFANLPWSPAILKQAEDRVHRIGLSHSVNIHYFLAEGTIDEHIYEVLQSKTSLFEKAIAKQVLQKILKKF